MEKELDVPMNNSKDFLDQIFANYLLASPETACVFSESEELTRPQLRELVKEYLAVINSVVLGPEGFIVLRGNNSPVQLAWVFAAVLSHIPFCLESDENDTLSLNLLQYGPVLKVDTDSSHYSVFPARGKVKGQPSQWAYIVNTSGSTGKPKLIPISRSNVKASLNAAQNTFPFTSKETWLWQHRLSFDLAIWEIFGAILFGANLNVVAVPVADWTGREVAFVADNLPQIITFTPSELKTLSTAGEDATQRVLAEAEALIFCGERLGWDSLQFLPSTALPDEILVYNAYGPSETTLICCTHRLSNRDLKLTSVPLGKPIGDTSFRISEQTGELFISGSQVFDGYLGTQKDWGDEYPTGDVVEDKGEGRLIFKNRVAGFLKINGERVDPYPTIEAICRLPGILDAHIWVKSDPPFDQVIAAVKTGEENPPGTRELRKVIKSAGVKVRPAKFVFVPSSDWPITKRGKLDHQALVKEIEERDK